MVAQIEAGGSPSYRPPDALTDAAIEWFLKMQAGEAKQAELDAWLAADPGRRERFAAVQSLWNCPALTAATAEIAPASHIQAAAGRRAIQGSRFVRAGAPRLRRLMPALLAASIALAVILPLLSNWLLRPSPDFQTGPGQIATFVLPDGSHMQLNSRSSVAVDFADGRRAVRLIEGEAFFDVAHDAAHPFIVRGGFGQVRVTGTRFDVARDDDEDVVHLENGSVTLEDDRAAQRMNMRPGQTAALRRNSIQLLPDDDTESRLAWRDGWVQLSSVPLGQALREIARHTDLRMITSPGAQLDTPVSGSFRIADARAAIDTIAAAGGAKARSLPGGIVFIH
ncbi:transmembrane sensor [Agrobacterium vitis]|nr:transmembrane sensor [Agrobacterium vitis]MBE1436693.1 transmembrane sensor [Agrobacterium vitis]